MKKITAFILCLTIIFSTMLMTTQSAFAIAEDFHKYDVIVGLGFMDLYPTGNFENSNVISRAEFAEILCKVANVPLEVGTPAFDDVDDNTIKKDYIYTAVKAGLLNGTGENVFSPNEFVTFNQAVKVLVTLLGYDTLAKQEGGYPMGYVKYAVQADILTGIKAGGETELTRVGFANLIYNALHARLWEIDGMSSTGTFGYKTGHTMLDAYHGYFWSEGIVEANDNTYYNNASKRAIENNVVINSKTYGVLDTDAKNLIGQNVEYYYKENEKGLFDLVCIVPKHNGIQYIDAKDINRAKSTFKTVYWFDENDKEKELNLAQDLKVIYNGVYYFEALLSDLYPMVGDIIFIDNNDDDIFDIANVNSYELKFVSHTISNSQTIITKDNSIYILEDYENIYFERAEVKTTDGDEVISTLQMDDNILVAESKPLGNKQNIKILASGERFIDTFVKANSDGEYFTKKTSYKLNPQNSTATAAKIKMGETFTLIFDAKGYIADVDASAGSNYAYLIDVKRASKGLNPDMSIKFYATDGKIHTYMFANNFEIVDSSGVSNRYNKESAELLVQAELKFKNAGVTVNQLIKYQLNATDQVIKVELPQTKLFQNNSNGFAMNLRGYHYRNPDGILVYADEANPVADTNSLNGLYSIRRSAMFTVPTSASSADLNNEGLYSYSSGTSALESNKAYDIEVYDADENLNCAVIVRKAMVSDSIALEDQVFFVIEGINEVLTIEGNIEKTISGYTKGKYAEYKVTDSNLSKISSLKKGDAIFASLDEAGYISGLKIALVDYKAQDVYSGLTDTFYLASPTTNSAIASRQHSTDRLANTDALLGTAPILTCSGVATKAVKVGAQYEITVEFTDLGTDIPYKKSLKFVRSSNKTAAVYYDPVSGQMWYGDFDEIEPGDIYCFSGYVPYYYSSYVIKQ